MGPGDAWCIIALAMSEGETTAGAASEPRIKGAAIQPFLAWYAREWGREPLREAVAGIPQPLRACFNLDDEQLGVLPSAWYPAASIHAFLDRLLARHDAAERRRITAEGARAVIESTLTGVYRWLFQVMMSPERYARNAHKLFSRYYEPGTMLKQPLGERGHLTIVRDWPGHHPLLCDFLVHTAEYVYSALGCRELEIRRVACISQGDGDCRFEVRWAAG